MYAHISSPSPSVFPSSFQGFPVLESALSPSYILTTPPHVCVVVVLILKLAWNQNWKSCQQSWPVRRPESDPQQQPSGDRRIPGGSKGLLCLPTRSPGQRQRSLSPLPSLRGRSLCSWVSSNSLSASNSMGQSPPGERQPGLAGCPRR